MSTFYWHDYETFGANPRVDRPAQFAGLRTDDQLNPIGEPLVVYCQPTDDALPQPAACLITGITPQLARQRGVSEPEFAALIHQQMATPETCGVGYNSIRFDDEVTRHLLYRNFFEPYAREWQHGNSRWDLIDVVRLCYALRPDGIHWPNREDGAPSFRLEDLSAANALEHAEAHDALSDVRATIELARLLRSKQPRLFEHCLKLRKKSFARAQLDFVNLKPVLHASGKYRSERGGLAMVVPICPHPINRNGIVVYDLSMSPEPLLTLDPEAIHDRVFTATAELPEGAERIALKTVHLNKSPVLSPISALQGVELERIGMDRRQCLHHLEQIRAASGLAGKVQQVFAQPFVAGSEQDPEQALYADLIAPSEQATSKQLRTAPPEQLASVAAKFSDPRLIELAWRYRARFHPGTLSASERQRWQQERQRRLRELDDGQPLLDVYRQQLTELKATTEAPERRAILDQLVAWANELAASLSSGQP